MLDKLRSIDLHYQDLEARLGASETYADPALVARLNKEQRELEPVVTAYRAYMRRKKDLADAETLMTRISGSWPRRSSSRPGRTSSAWRRS